MSVRNAFVLFLAFSALTFLVACGGNSSPKPNPVGFNTSSMTGTYVFSTAGYDNNAPPGFLTMTGAFVANSGSISSGTVDVASADVNFGVATNQPITNGSYNVGADGRGQANFNVAVAGGTATFTLDFVLTSNAHGLITEFDSNGSGSGTIDLQPTAVSQSSLANSYAFAASGAGVNAGSTTAGSMTLDASGNVTTGVEDINNGGSATADLPIPTSSFVTVGTGTTPGTAQIGSSTFDVYPIDSTHFKLIETDGLVFVIGDAFTLASSLPASATLAFAMSGGDQSGLPLGVGGLMTLDSNSNVVGGSGLEDFNDAGVVNTDTTFGGGFTALSGGRSTLSLSGFVNGAANDIASTYIFAAYPFTSNGVTGVELVEIDGLGITSGVAYVQTGTALNASQNFGLNLSAVNFGSGSSLFEEDDIAQFATTSNSFSGIMDINDEGTTSFKQSFSGDFSALSTGRYSVTNGNLVNFALYAVNSSTFLILETDNVQTGTGIVELQSSSGSPGAEPGISMPLPGARPAHIAARRQK